MLQVKRCDWRQHRREGSEHTQGRDKENKGGTRDSSEWSTEHLPWAPSSAAVSSKSQGARCPEPWAELHHQHWIFTHNRGVRHAQAGENSHLSHLRITSASAQDPGNFSLESTFPLQEGSAHSDFSTAFSPSSRVSGISEALKKTTTCSYMEYKDLSSQRAYLLGHTQQILTYLHLIQQILVIPLHVFYFRSELTLTSVQNPFKIPCI